MGHPAGVSYLSFEKRMRQNKKKSSPKILLYAQILSSEMGHGQRLEKCIHCPRFGQDVNFRVSAS